MQDGSGQVFELGWVGCLSQLDEVVDIDFDEVQEFFHLFFNGGCWPLSWVEKHGFKWVFRQGPNWFGRQVLRYVACGFGRCAEKGGAVTLPHL
jgi:hypothetical protein